MICRVLIVDDEPAMVENIAALLESLPETDTDIYRAYNARQALAILHEGAMDLVICDIEMPGMNGLELQRHILEIWPECKVGFLTAYSRFDYIYEAVQNRATQYLLKSESDGELRQKLKALLREATRPARFPLPNPEVRDPLFSLSHVLPDALLTPSCSDVPGQLVRTGFSPDSDRYFFLICLLDGQSSCGIVLDLMNCYLAGNVLHTAQSWDSEKKLLTVLVQPKELPLIDPITHISGMLEKLQQVYTQHLQQPIPMLVMPFSSSATTPADCHRIALGQLARLSLQQNVVFTCMETQSEPEGDIAQSTIQWICRYVEEHISEDLSLVHISRLAGYNIQYLSGLFHSVRGITLTRYIMQIRLKRALELLADERIPMNEIANRVGIESRSYFNRFIKRETGYPPQELRSRMLKGK